jgi:DNA-binding MarR family transcriptional regulator
LDKPKKSVKPKAAQALSQGKHSPPRPHARPANAALRSNALEQSIGYLLRRAQFSTYNEFSQTMEPFDLRPSQFAVLALIRSNPGLTQSAVCSALGIQKTNFVALLDKLESRGLTERRKLGGDRRASALHITHEGQDFVARMESAHAAMEGRVAQRLGVKRTRELMAVLREFIDKV